jgi:hypothetical protein
MGAEKIFHKIFMFRMVQGIGAAELGVGEGTRRIAGATKSMSELCSLDKKRQDVMV